MKRRVAIINYGVGNIHSVRRAAEVNGALQFTLCDSAKDLSKADRIILPGVGSFGDGMKGLRKRGLIQPLIDVSRAGC